MIDFSSSTFAPLKSWFSEQNAHESITGQLLPVNELARRMRSKLGHEQQAWLLGHASVLRAILKCTLYSIVQYHPWLLRSCSLILLLTLNAPANPQKEADPCYTVTFKSLNHGSAWPSLKQGSWPTLSYILWIQATSFCPSIYAAERPVDACLLPSRTHKFSLRAHSAAIEGLSIVLTLISAPDDQGALSSKRFLSCTSSKFVSLNNLIWSQKYPYIIQ